MGDRRVKHAKKRASSDRGQMSDRVSRSTRFHGQFTQASLLSSAQACQSRPSNVSDRCQLNGGPRDSIYIGQQPRSGPLHSAQAITAYQSKRPIEILQAPAMQRQRIALHNLVPSERISPKPYYIHLFFHGHRGARLSMFPAC